MEAGAVADNVGLCHVWSVAFQANSVLSPSFDAAQFLHVTTLQETMEFWRVTQHLMSHWTLLNKLPNAYTLTMSKVGAAGDNMRRLRLLFGSDWVAASRFWLTVAAWAACGSVEWTNSVCSVVLSRQLNMLALELWLDADVVPHADEVAMRVADCFRLDAALLESLGAPNCSLPGSALVHLNSLATVTPRPGRTQEVQQFMSLASMSLQQPFDATPLKQLDQMWPQLVRDTLHGQNPPPTSAPSLPSLQKTEDLQRLAASLDTTAALFDSRVRGTPAETLLHVVAVRERPTQLDLECLDTEGCPLCLRGSRYFDGPVLLLKHARTRREHTCHLACLVEWPRMPVQLTPDCDKQFRVVAGDKHHDVSQLPASATAMPSSRRLGKIELEICQLLSDATALKVDWPPMALSVHPHTHKELVVVIMSGSSLQERAIFRARRGRIHFGFVESREEEAGAQQKPMQCQVDAVYDLSNLGDVQSAQLQFGSERDGTLTLGVQRIELPMGVSAFALTFLRFELSTLAKRSIASPLLSSLASPLLSPMSMALAAGGSMPLPVPLSPVPLVPGGMSPLVMSHKRGLMSPIPSMPEKSQMAMAQQLLPSPLTAPLQSPFQHTQQQQQQHYHTGSDERGRSMLSGPQVMRKQQQRRRVGSTAMRQPISINTTAGNTGNNNKAQSPFVPDRRLLMSLPGLTPSPTISPTTVPPQKKKATRVASFRDNTRLSIDTGVSATTGNKSVSQEPTTDSNKTAIGAVTAANKAASAATGSSSSSSSSTRKNSKKKSASDKESDDSDDILAHVVGRVATLARSQTGSRFIQEHLEDAKMRRMFFQEMRGEVAALMMDSFGHYAIEALLKSCSAKERFVLLQELCKDKAEQFSTVACHKQGSFSLQAAMSLLETEQEIEQVSHAIRSQLLVLVAHASGHYVVLRFLSHFPRRAAFVQHSFAQHCLAYGTDHYGLRVAKSLVSAWVRDPGIHGRSHKRIAVSQLTPEMQEVLDAIVLHTCHLVENQYGNYLIQHVLDVAPDQITERVKHEMRGNYARYSKQKFSSNVVEKALTTSEMHWRRLIVNELLESAAELVNDRYGNYCLQTALSCCDRALAVAFAAEMQHHLPQLRENVRVKWRKLLDSRVQKTSRDNHRPERRGHGRRHQSYGGDRRSHNRE